MTTKIKGFELPKKIMFDEQTYSATFGKIEAEPFEKGYGITICNSLRRILLSSIEGTAVTKIKIDGVSHEFDAIPGVYEDVPQIIMNIKGLVLRSYFKEPKPIFISMNKKGVITAKDIKTDETVEIINPDHHIATLTEDVKFEMEMTVERGRGFVPAERNKKGDSPLETIFIDSMFSPVQRVNISVVDTRVGHITDYDKLVMEIFTNGSMEPKDAIRYAANVLQRHLEVFMTIGKDWEFMDEPDDSGTGASELVNKLSEPISNLELSVRSANCLTEANIRTIGDLVSIKETDMLKYKNFGKKSLTEINKILAERGLHLGMEVNDN
ncbi:MAG: DNA-directed RNA polymerase subunit alpha [Candidatus Omnitrophica bacterium]|nr:DNA-directed RNA polymerase subunit alpha [Candidatus Omnitrophota bacterium]